MTLNNLTDAQSQLVMVFGDLQGDVLPVFGAVVYTVAFYRSVQSRTNLAW